MIRKEATRNDTVWLQLFTRHNFTFLFTPLPRQRSILRFSRHASSWTVQLLLSTVDWTLCCVPLGSWSRVYSTVTLIGNWWSSLITAQPSSPHTTKQRWWTIRCSVFVLCHLCVGVLLTASGDGKNCNTLRLYLPSVQPESVILFPTYKLEGGAASSLVHDLVHIRPGHCR